MEIEADVQPLAIPVDFASSLTIDSADDQGSDTDADEYSLISDSGDVHATTTPSSTSTYSSSNDSDSSSWDTSSTSSTTTSAYTYKANEPRDPNNPTNKEDLRRNKWKKINSKYDKKMTPIVPPMGANSAGDNYFWSGEDEYLSDPSMVNNGGGSHSTTTSSPSKKQQVSIARLLLYTLIQCLYTHTYILIRISFIVYWYTASVILLTYTHLYTYPCRYIQ